MTHFYLVLKLRCYSMFSGDLYYVIFLDISMQLVVVLFSENLIEFWLDFNPLHCEILRTPMSGVEFFHIVAGFPRTECNAIL